MPHSSSALVPAPAPTTLPPSAAPAPAPPPAPAAAERAARAPAPTTLPPSAAPASAPAAAERAARAAAPPTLPASPSRSLRREPKALLLYASYGDGHLQAAKAIRAQLAERGCGPIRMVDLMAEAHPLLDALSRCFYRSSYRLFPGVYGWLYERTRLAAPGSALAAVLHAPGRRRLRQLLREERPDLVLHTFPLFPGPPAGSPDRPALTAAIVTDYDLHRRWVHPGIDRYYAASEEMKSELLAAGVPEERVCFAGIPVRPGFDARRRGSDRSALERRGFNPELPLVLLMGGGAGILGGLLPACGRLLAERPQVQLALVCGRNEAFARDARRRFAGRPDSSRLHVLDYVEELPELMLHAACLVTKPGGLTIAEGLAAGVPLVLYRPVPGQERRNAAYAARLGAAAVVRTPEALVEAVLKLLDDPERLKESARRAGALGRPDGAGRIADDLLQRLEGYTGKERPIRPSSVQGGTSDEGNTIAAALRS
ncbi:MGDG synthase family glycosyltransferase [Paenibacillus sp. B01]|uniref:MGDG synthase family glycosyltransferase n=1 Tax=Paenibacillus sp. B01 TaxID=2660554 RepID=UPI00129A51E5|nr:glycosyltransferase [Paenibacillus sp. B01]QGG58020.1 glycosyltransferase [Paenibacillus sp. B01]